MTKLRLFFVIAAGFVALVFWTQSREHLAIDRCLDGGGRWSYEAEVCETG